MHILHILRRCVVHSLAMEIRDRVVLFHFAVGFNAGGDAGPAGLVRTRLPTLFAQ
jgi:hypothetical protein